MRFREESELVILLLVIPIIQNYALSLFGSISFKLSFVLCRSWELQESFASSSSRRPKLAPIERDSAPGWHWLTETHQTHPTPLTYHPTSLWSVHTSLHTSIRPCVFSCFVLFFFHKNTRLYSIEIVALLKTKTNSKEWAVCVWRDITKCNAVYLSQGGCSFD